MKKILKEWKEYLKENEGFNYDGFIKEFVEIFGNAVSYDSNFYRIVQKNFYPEDLLRDLPTKKFNKVTEINFVDRAKAATPTPPLIAAHLNLLKLNLFFDFE